MREQEKSIQDFEALHSCLISLDKSDEEQDTVVTGPLVWRAEEVATKKDYRTSKGRQCVNRRVGPPTNRSHNEVPEKLLCAMKL